MEISLKRNISGKKALSVNNHADDEVPSGRSKTHSIDLTSSLTKTSIEKHVR